MTRKFDIVIPVGPADILSMQKVVKYARKNIVGHRNIYLISYDKNLVVEGCVTIDENLAPFNKEEIRSHFQKKEFRDNCNWYYQQLLKFYAFEIIPDLLDDFLIMDADVYFLKPIRFFEDDKALLAYADLLQEPYHEPYFRHMKALNSGLRRFNKDYSGICHHCMFNKDRIRSLFNLTKSGLDRDFWRILLDCVDENDSLFAISEHEIYFNFMLLFHADECKIRKLSWKNVYYEPNFWLNLFVFNKYDFVSKFVRGSRLKYLVSRIRHYIPFRKKVKNFFKSMVG